MQKFRQPQSGITQLAIVFFLTLGSVKGLGQDFHVLEPVSKHYKVLVDLSAQPNPVRAYMDTINYPWSEYGKGALTNSLMRTFYLSKAKIEWANHKKIEK